MASKGRPKKSLYDKYVTAFNRAKKTLKGSMYDDQLLSKSEFNYIVNTNKTDAKAIKEVIDRHKYGRTSTEVEGRRDFYETVIKKNNPKVKWSEVKYMSHEDFVETYQNEIEDIYNDFINSGYAPAEIKQLISQYIFGSE